MNMNKTDKKDTAYIVAIVVLVGIIAGLALYRANSSPEEILPINTETQQKTLDKSENRNDQQELADQQENSSETEEKISAEASKKEAIQKLQLQLEQIKKDLSKAEKKAKEAQRKLNDQVQTLEDELETDSTIKKAVKNLLFWQNEVERLQYQYENISERLK